jgi:hypothetical protein
MTLLQKQHRDADDSGGRLRNRRRVARSVTERAHCFSIEHADGIVIGVLLDYTSQGFGFEVFERLTVGQSVTLKGSIEVNGVWKKVRGDARVAHCEPSEDGTFRLGFFAEDVKWATTFDPNTPLLEGASRYTAG